MRRHRTDDATSTGHDSFLDIVANLVGILVILIMVVGVRAKQAHLSSASHAQAPPAESPPAQGAPVALANGAAAAAPATPPPSAAPAPQSEPPQAASDNAEALASSAPDEPPFKLPDVETPRVQAERLRAASWELDAERQELVEQAEFQRGVRDQTQLLVSLAERELAAARERLDANQQQQLDRQLEEKRLSDELASIRQHLADMEAPPAEATVIEHHPTPLAKTVFGQELHFRLLGGQLTYVPVNEFIEILKREAERKLWKLENASETTETIGPIDGFVMRYTLQRRITIVRTEQGLMQRQGVELAGFVLLPVQEPLGEPLSAALADNSAVMARLLAARPDETTITVWTYPDSFQDYQQLKQFLWDRGFLTAARPLPAGFPISGSPEGNRSAAQ